VFLGHLCLWYNIKFSYVNDLLTSNHDNIYPISGLCNPILYNQGGAAPGTSKPPILFNPEGGPNTSNPPISYNRGVNLSGSTLPLGNTSECQD
jgi:hypothetical protein